MPQKKEKKAAPSGRALMTPAQKKEADIKVHKQASSLLFMFPFCLYLTQILVEHPLWLYYQYQFLQGLAESQAKKAAKDAAAAK